MRRIAWIVFAGLLVWAAAGFTASMVPARRRVEVAFVLDSTGSMSDLIEGAKGKIWSIANDIISRASPRGSAGTEVRIGLVTYRDRGDEYVTRRFDLTNDIDAVYKNLQSITADGGGDDPESVNQALHEAVNDLAWTKDAKVLKIIFLVGDYPPHMDYPGDVTYDVTARQAVKSGIIIDTVQCGDVAETTPVWKEIARRADGSYVALAQSGNMTAMTTPYDEEIAKVSRDMGSTVIAYGDAAQQAESREKVAKASAAPSGVAADRAAFNLASGGKAIQGTGDLVADVKDGSVDVVKLKSEELPPELRRMSPAERSTFIKARQVKRDSLNAKLAELSRKRAGYVEKERARLTAAGRADAFDTKVSEIIAEQSGRIR